MVIENSCKMLKCEICDKVFQRRLHVAQHRRTHSEYRPYKCQFGHCLQSFPILSQLQVHQRYHIDHRRYHCRICQVRYLSQSHLERHKCQPHYRRVHKCHICSATFLRVLTLANHIYEQHPKAIRARRLQCQQNLKRNKKRSRFKASDIENGDDSKILLKITLGKSMTIISPSKKSNTQNTGSKRKFPKKKSKKKRRKEDKKQEKKGIILSIKKGMVNVKDTRMTSKTKQAENINGLVNTEYKLGEQKSELKLTIKACPDLTDSPSKGENYKVLEKSDSRSSLKLEKRTSSRTDIDTIECMSIGNLSPHTPKECDDSKIRNGIVIMKDKTGKLLAEQLRAKSKKRDNVFESFNDVGIWKVLESPRDRPNDILKLKLSPQKPARIESTLEEACAFNASKYLDIPVNSVKGKGEVSGEDSDILDVLPQYEKENDGMNNVNDSGIEVLSSSSCNRSNGNSVRSVVMEDNSPTYFHTEDSLLSLDSPFTEGMNKAEHSICHKCGGLIMEANNNSRSPGKCRCNPSNPLSLFEMPISPVKTNLLSPYVAENNDGSVNLDQLTNSELNCDNKMLIEEQTEEITESAEQERSEGEDSDIMIITFDKNQNNSEDRKGRLKLKFKSRNQNEQKSVMDTLLSPRKAKRSPSVSPSKSENQVNVKPKSFKAESEKMSNEKSDSNNKQDYQTENKSSDGIESVVGKNTQESVIPTKTDIEESASSPYVADVEETNSPSVKCVKSSQHQEENKNQIRKKPLFKSKRTTSYDKTSSLDPLPSTDHLQQSAENPSVVNDEKTLQKKKPLFKKRTLSADENYEQKSKKPCFKSQFSVPATTTSEKFLKDKTGVSSSTVKTFVSANEEEHNDKPDSEKDSERKRIEGKSTVSEIAETSSKTEGRKLCTIGLDEEDSLLNLSGDIGSGEKVSSPVEKIQKSAISFDLYQQQFLSFISNTMSSNKSDKKQNAANPSDSAKNEAKNSSEIKDDRRPGIEEAEINLSDSKDREIKHNKTRKRMRKKLSSKSKIPSEKKCSDEAKEELEVDANNERSKDVNLPEKKQMIKIEKSDSLSWLNIFGKSATTENQKKNDKENAADVMTDLSENLAEINKKIDVSEDDDTNSLDVDNVFQVENLSSLQPKHEINVKRSQTKILKDNEHVEREKNINGSPYKRKQTAKRTVGKFKSAKRKVESDYEYSEESSEAETIDLLSSHRDSDPDFNPFVDSDDDFVKGPHKRHESRTCNRVKKRTFNGSECSDSDNESKCSEFDKLDSESQSSRSKRTKKGRKSCCPCCIGSPRKSSHSSDQHLVTSRDAYKLPRNHKLFVRSTLKLLQLQEKIHTLFLTLFPECAEMITHSNIGTEEFESLIDDVLSSFEDRDKSYDSIANSVDYFVKEEDNQYVSCPASNIEMPFTTSGSATRTSEIDLINTTGLDRSPNGLVKVDSHMSHTHTLSNSQMCSEDNVYEFKSAGKDFNTGISWQQTTFFNQSTSVPSSSSLKFENNTLADKDEPVEEGTYENVISNPSAVSESSLAYTQESFGATETSDHYGAQSQLEVVNVAPVTHLGILDHAEPFEDIDYYAPEVDSDPGVESGITITLDLNAARVSLCRTPKNCLQRLHNQIIKMSKCFFPKIEFKNYFYKNIDNLEFLLDLMLEANSSDNALDIESEHELFEEEVSDKWHNITSNEITLLEPPIIKEDDTVKVNFLGVKNELKTEEREPLFVKCSDLFEQEIKSQRESLKKDVFSLEEEKSEEDTWKNAEQVLNSISSLKEMARKTEMAQRTRRPRDCRLRKRSADEKRTLFVQEKLQNNQNSSIVCYKQTRSGKKAKVGRKKSQPVNSKKKRFLSELNLGDKLVNEETETEHTENSKEKMNGHIKAIDKQSETNDQFSLYSRSVTVVVGDLVRENGAKDRSERATSHEETDCIAKAGDKNIFELMQPS